MLNESIVNEHTDALDEVLQDRSLGVTRFKAVTDGVVLVNEATAKLLTARATLRNVFSLCIIVAIPFAAAFVILSMTR